MLTPPRLWYCRTALISAGPPVMRGQLDGVLEGSHPASRQKSGDRQFAGLVPDRIAAFDFADPLELAETSDQA